MTDFLVYEGKVAVAIAAFYMFYRLLLSKDTMHFFNRIVLLSTAVLSFILPFCVITVHRTVERAASDSAVGELMVSGMSEVPAGSDYWAIALLAVYVAGVVAVLVRMGVSMASAMEMIRKGCLVREEDGIRIIVSDKKIAPFSYMKYIVMSGEDWLGRNEDIIVHETAHIRRRHSVDVMLVELITAFQWFNPAVWMLRADLRALHEYEADDAVLRSGADVKEYQYLLIRKAVGASGYSITNSFNHSTLKNRITMMSCKKSSLRSAWKALYIVPLVGLSLAASARTVVDFRQPEGFASVPDSLGLKGKAVSVDTLSKTQSGNIIVVGHDKNNEKSGKFNLPIIVDGVKMSPEEFGKIGPDMIECINVFKDGSAVAKYGEEAKGGAIVVTLKKGQETSEAERVSAVLDEVAVVAYKGKEKASEDEVPLSELTEFPKFDGKDLNAFSKYVNMNIVYPKAVDGADSGTVTVSFTVGKDGKVKNVRIIKGVSQALDEEVVRVVSGSPKWKPGKVDGKPVDVTFALPVSFNVR